MKPSRNYVLVTPAKNEAAVIEQTIASVVSQTELPCEWVIVSDGSTDGTDKIVLRAAQSFPWIRLLALPERPSRSFSSVVHATEAGIQHLGCRDYRYLGLLDSDVRFQENYFEKVMDAFEDSPRLGLAGGVVIDVGLDKNRLPRNRQNVPGAVQFFSRECFERIGQLIPVPEGGWDAITCVQARMKGYETRLLVDLVVDHLKPRNVSEGGAIRRKWQMGVRDYVLGWHPVFEIAKCLSRIKDPPLLLGSLAWMFGYVAAWLKGPKRVVPNDVFKFARREQRQALLTKLFSLFRATRRGPRRGHLATTT